MRLERTKRELIKTYRKQTKAGALTDCLLIAAVKMATCEGKGLAADIVVGYAKWIQQQQIALMMQGTDHAGQHQAEGGGTTPGAPGAVQAGEGVQGAEGAVPEVQERAGASGMSTERTPGADGHQEHQGGAAGDTERPSRATGSPAPAQAPGGPVQGITRRRDRPR
jgi:hypothetical protein